MLGALAGWMHSPVGVVAVLATMSAAWVLGMRQARTLASAPATDRPRAGGVAAVLPEAGSPEVRALAEAFSSASAAAILRDDSPHGARDHAAAQRDLFSSIINASSDGLLLYDTSRTPVAATTRCGELLGFSIEQLLQRPPDDLVADIEARAALPHTYRAQLDRHFATGDEAHQDVLVLAKPRRRVLRRHSCPVVTTCGVQGRVFTYTDVTADSDLGKMKSEFVSTASHELRTPLTSVHAALQLALSGSGDRLAAEDHELLEISLANTERLVRLVNDLLDLSKLEAGRMPFDVSPVSVGQLLEEAARGVQVLSANADARIVAEPADASLHMAADHDQVLRVLTNLLSNAIKYSAAGSRVRLTARAAHDGVEVTVEDEGPGIPPDQVHRLFHPFSRLGRHERQASGGTGLGLAISRAIVEQHGGRIWWERALPRGSRFMFVIPCPGVAAMPGASDAATSTVG